MTFKEFIKILLLVVLPILIIVFVSTITVCSITENDTIRFIISILSAIVYAFLLMKWCNFVDDHDWI